MSNKKFAAAINCMDGRAQLPVIEFLTKKLGVDYVDVITEAGPIKALADNADKGILDSIRKRLLVSVEKHHSKTIAVVGHHDCAGNPVSEVEQRRQIKEALTVVGSWQLGAELLGLWLGASWQVEEIKPQGNG